MANRTRINKTKDKNEIVEYPLYDSEMVDNIGHRSRVLLSIKENTNVIDNETDSREDIVRSKVKGSTEVLTTKTGKYFKI